MVVNKQYKIFFKRYIVLTLNRYRDYIYIYRLYFIIYPQIDKNCSYAPFLSHTRKP